MAYLLLESGETFVLASSGKAFGSTGYETVKVIDGATITSDASVERVELPRPSTAYTYQAIPTGIAILLNGSVVANLQTGQKVAFTNGSALIASTFDPVSGATFTFGGKTVSTTAGSLALTLSTSAGEASTMTPVVTNNAPVAVNDSIVGAKAGLTTTIDVVANDFDADGDILTPTVVIGSLSRGGSAEVVNGKVNYTPTIGFVGTETFNYTVTDGRGGTSNQATVSVSVISNTGGSSGDDLIYGSSAAELIDGISGNDTIIGGGARERLVVKSKSWYLSQGLPILVTV